MSHKKIKINIRLVSNYEFNSFKNHRQVPAAGDTSLQSALKVNSDAAPSLRQPIIFGIHKEVSSGASILRDQIMETDVAVEISEHAAQENQNQHQTFDLQSKSQYLRLYLAALKGNWQDANQILRVEAESDCIQYSITQTNESILHVAFASKHMAFIKGVVQLLSSDDLELTNVDGDTALCFAAKSGIVPIAKEMVKKNNNLPLIRSSSEGRTPLHQAALLGRRDMVSYLFSVTRLNELTLDERMEILIATITHDMYDIALKILGADETLAIANDGKNIAALHELARKHSKSQLSLCKPCFKSSSMQKLVDELVARVSREVKLFEDKQFSYIVRTLLFDAVEFGNIEFLDILIGSYPNIIWTIDDHRRSLLHIAVKNRQESVFNLIYETVAAKEIILTYVDCSKQNILHLAGELAPPRRLNIVSGAALQMQRELLWFKEVEKIVPPSYLNMKNSKGQTPGDIFTEKHEHLQKEGKEWMKDTANNCMIVATLITTVVFTAAFTVPGGSNQETGIPILLESIWFTVFFISDAIALLSSSSSILIFLSILTSRFTEMDFLVSLPSKLVLGLTTLFISIAGMLVSFSATCFLVYKSKMVRFPIVITSLAGVPIILFIFLHYKLWTDIIHSICLSMFLFRRRKNKLF
ncbi:hypothetical protein SO802_029643 [Lithocarpus litseifolius]|uniref:PGG domain-containing protein n=1 Tax=Lithocarpus litseifolius TaxID=425828 RepID=A0AAW2BX80_9ROSI